MTTDNSTRFSLHSLDTSSENTIYYLQLQAHREARDDRRKPLNPTLNSWIFIKPFHLNHNMLFNEGKHLDIHSIPLCPRSKLHSGTHKHWQSPFSWLQALHGLLSRWVVSHLSRRHRRRQLPHRSLPQSAGCAWSRAVRAFFRRSCREPYSGPSWEVAYYCESSCSPLSPPSPSNWPAPSAAQPGN